MSLVAIVSTDLLVVSRVADAAQRAGHSVVRVDRPSGLPPPVAISMVLVDWGARESDWGTSLSAWLASASERPRLVVFGPHTDLAAHAEAREAGIGPMQARSKVLPTLTTILEGASAP